MPNQQELADLREKEQTLLSLPRTEWNAKLSQQELTSLIFENNLQTSQQVLNNYEAQEKLGEGTYGVVFRAVHKHTKEIVALKHIRFESTDEGTPSTAIREVSLLRLLKHPNIVALLEIAHEEKAMVLVFEFLDQDLHNYIEGTPQGLDPTTICSFLFQLLTGLQFCHRARIYHRDLKPQNLLINFQGELKLADFGLARSGSVPINAFTHEVVTLWYRPPDVILGNTKYCEAIDLWGIGCIFAEMYTGKPLLPGANPFEQIIRIFKACGGPNNPSNTVWDPTRFTLWNDYEQRLLSEPKGREVLVCFPNLKSLTRRVPPLAYDLLVRFLHYDEKARITCEEALKHPYFTSLNEDNNSDNPYMQHITNNAINPNVTLVPIAFPPNMNNNTNNTPDTTNSSSTTNLPSSSASSTSSMTSTSGTISLTPTDLLNLNTGSQYYALQTLDPMNTAYQPEQHLQSLFNGEAPPSNIIDGIEDDLHNMQMEFDLESRALEAKRSLGRVAREYHALLRYETETRQRWAEEIQYHQFTFDSADYEHPGRLRPENNLVRYGNDMNGYIEVGFTDLMQDYAIGALMDQYFEYALKYPTIEGMQTGCADYFPVTGDDEDVSRQKQLLQADQQHLENPTQPKPTTTTIQIHPDQLTPYQILCNDAEAYSNQLQAEYSFIEENWLRFRMKMASIATDIHSTLLSLIPTVYQNVIREAYKHNETFANQSTHHAVITEDQFNWLVYQSTAGKMTEQFWINANKGTVKLPSLNCDLIKGRYDQYVAESRKRYVATHKYESLKLFTPAHGTSLFHGNLHGTSQQFSQPQQQLSQLQAPLSSQSSTSHISQ